METVIREYSTSDRNHCIEAFKSNVPDYFSRDEIQDFEDFLLRVEIGTTNTNFYVVEHDQKIIGCGGFGDREGKGIYSLAWGFIHKEFHKKGFGKELLLFRLDQIRKLNPEFQLILDTSQYSTKFFEKYGFKTIKITNDFYTTGMHRYDMVLNFKD
jgi:N-acetylglutamate synthase-like GNAT family acetyltransferase